MDGIIDLQLVKVRYDLHCDISRMPVDVEKMLCAHTAQLRCQRSVAL